MFIIYLAEAVTSHWLKILTWLPDKTVYWVLLIFLRGKFLRLNLISRLVAVRGNSHLRFFRRKLLHELLFALHHNSLDNRRCEWSTWCGATHYYVNSSHNSSHLQNFRCELTLRKLMLVNLETSNNFLTATSPSFPSEICWKKITGSLWYGLVGIFLQTSHELNFNWESLRCSRSI